MEFTDLKYVCDINLGAFVKKHRGAWRAVFSARDLGKLISAVENKEISRHQFREILKTYLARIEAVGITRQERLMVKWKPYI